MATKNKIIKAWGNNSPFNKTTAKRLRESFAQKNVRAPRSDAGKKRKP